MKDKEYKSWKKQRERGAVRYILLYGLFFWGGLMFALTTLANNNFFILAFINPSLTNFLTWVFGGALFGIIHWFIMEGVFKRAQRKRVSKGRPI